MEKVVITAIMKAKEGCEEQLLAELKKVRVPSVNEKGCVQYTLHQAEDAAFVLYEIWRDEAALEEHVGSLHYQEYRSNIADLIVSREVYKLKEIH